MKPPLRILYEDKILRELIPKFSWQPLDSRFERGYFIGYNSEFVALYVDQLLRYGLRVPVKLKNGNFERLKITISSKHKYLSWNI